MKVWILIFVLLSLVACDNSSNECGDHQARIQPLNLNALKKNREYYGSCQELEADLEKSRAKRENDFNRFSSGLNQCPSSRFSTTQPGASIEADQPTNTQVNGVDEADRVKVSQKFIFYAKSSGIEVIARDNLEKVMILPQQSLLRSGIFVYDEKLIVLQRLDSSIPEVLPASSQADLPSFQEDEFQVDIYDVMSTPRLKKSLKFNGKMQTTRLNQQGQLTIVSHTNMYPHFYDVARSQDQFKKISQNMDCSRVLKSFSDDFDPYLTTALSVDLSKSNFPFKKVELQGRYDKVYQSENLYLTKSYGYEPWGAAEIFEGSPIGNVTIKLSSNKKHWEIDDHFTYSGRVMGSWSFHEKDAYLFVATDTHTSRTSQLNVINTALDSAPPLIPVSGLAPGETIRSVRYTDEYAYIVTFRTVDPLFIIDIRNPEKVELKSELKIPGYSSYLHNISGDRLVGVGYSGDTFNLQLSLFDVSHPLIPQTLQQMTVEGGYTSSNSQTNHHSFFYDSEWEMVALPVQALSYDLNQTSSYGGAHIYNVSGSSFDKMAYVSHQHWFQEYCAETFGQPSSYFVMPDIYSLYRIDNRLMSFSDIGYKSHDPKSPNLTLHSEEFHDPQEACQFQYGFDSQW